MRQPRPRALHPAAGARRRGRWRRGGARRRGRRWRDRARLGQAPFQGLHSRAVRLPRVRRAPCRWLQARHRHAPCGDRCGVPPANGLPPRGRPVGEGPRFCGVSGLPCPCGSGAAYRACCGPVLRGDSPAVTAEALMRSRYTAYVRRDEAYLLRTWEAAHRPESLDLDDTVWLGLEVLATEAGSADDAHGIVEFVASYLDDRGAVERLRERSRFARAGGSWQYVDGDATAYGASPSIQLD
ncbi:MAG: hypothetical protein HGA51_09410 [Demequinaceae bacterium]|nr:hypothetical protein [Demequinaceae bacterium]